jgi:hypothetical protein
MPFDEFASALRSRVWDVVARGNWRPFEEARAFARELGLSGGDAWQEYAQSDEKPRDIPASPWAVYENDWISMGDWLRNGQRRGGWRPLEESRAFVQTLNSRTSRYGGSTLNPKIGQRTFRLILMLSIGTIAIASQGKSPLIYRAIRIGFTPMTAGSTTTIGSTLMGGALSGVSSSKPARSCERLHRFILSPPLLFSLALHRRVLWVLALDPVP